MKLQELLVKYEQLSMQPIFGYELEFYLPRNNSSEVEEILNIKLQQEKGLLQYEANMGPFSDVFKMIKSIEALKRNLSNMYANLSSKPFVNDYGSSLHLHFNILDAKSVNLFENKETLEYAANGICRFMRETIYALLNQEEDYIRFDARFMAPTHICFGNNNRTVALRIPDQKPTRLEHRLCSPLSDVCMAVFTILKSALWGIENKHAEYNKIFGNAFDDQYNLELLPSSVADAKRVFNQDFFNQI